MRKVREIALFIRINIPFTVIDNISHEIGMCELVNCHIKCKGQGVLSSLFYSSSSYEVNEVWLDGLNTWLQSGQCLIIGDLMHPW